MPFILVLVPADTALLLSGRNSEPGFNPPDPGGQGCALSAQVPVGELPRVLRRAGDRPRPARRRLGRQGPFPFPARLCLSPVVETPFTAAGGQATAREGAKVHACLPQDRSVIIADPQPGPDPGPDRSGGDERLRDVPESGAHPLTTADPGPTSPAAGGPSPARRSPRPGFRLDAGRRLPDGHGNPRSDPHRPGIHPHRRNRQRPLTEPAVSSLRMHPLRPRPLRKIHTT